MRLIQLGILISLLSTFAPACASNPSAVNSQKVVQINEMKLTPEVVQLSGSKNSIAWTNWSSSWARVVFPGGMTSAFTCTDLRPQFAFTGDRIQSINASGDNMDLVTPCPLKPGSYEYEVWLYEPRFDRGDPRTKVKGRIEVSP